MSACSTRSRQAATAAKEATLTTGLTVVLRQQARVATLQHVVHALDGFVDVSWQWSIARACALSSEDPNSDDGGARRLVARIVARRPLAEMDVFYRRAQLSAGLVNAAQRGDAELVRWLLDNVVTERFIVDSHSGIFKAAEAAATKGHLHVLEHVLGHDKHGVSVKPAMLAAARGNNLNALKWLYERLVGATDLSDCASALLEAAAGNGNTEMASWVVEIVGADCLRLAVASAAQSAISGGHLDMISSLVAIASSIDGPLCLDEAAGKGYLQAVQWGFSTVVCAPPRPWTQLPPTAISRLCDGCNTTALMDARFEPWTKRQAMDSWRSLNGCTNTGLKVVRRQQWMEQQLTAISM